jgi:hypothetical protein
MWTKTLLLAGTVIVTGSARSVTAAASRTATNVLGAARRVARRSGAGMLKSRAGEQGCQIFLDTIPIPKQGELYQMATKLPNGLEIYQMVVEFINLLYSKGLKNLP